MVKPLGLPCVLPAHSWGGLFAWVGAGPRRSGFQGRRRIFSSKNREPNEFREETLFAVGASIFVPGWSEAAFWSGDGFRELEGFRCF